MPDCKLSAHWSHNISNQAPSTAAGITITSEKNTKLIQDSDSHRQIKVPSDVNASEIICLQSIFPANKV